MLGRTDVHSSSNKTGETSLLFHPVDLAIHNLWTLDLIILTIGMLRVERILRSASTCNSFQPPPAFCS